MVLRQVGAGFVAVALGLGCGSPASVQAQGPAPAGAEARELAGPELAALSREISESSELVYFSDYFSFVGGDAEGRVAFALDNNRGRDGAAYQAEHFVIFHDEKAGFIDVPGYGKYDNPGGELRGIPDSPYFSFSGSTAEGLVVRSRKLPLELRIQPLEPRVGRAVGDRAIFYMASAPATLQWKSRTLEGRVIHEYLVVKDWNRLSRSALPYLFSHISFQGLYLMTPDRSDLYVHKTNGGLAPLGSSVARLGFYSEGGATEEAQGLDLVVERKEQGLGLFRWPVAWTSSWTTATHGAGRLRAEVVDFKRVGSFFLGGFGMGIVKGTIEQDGREIPVYGWAELVLWRA